MILDDLDDEAGLEEPEPESFQNRFCSRLPLVNGACFVCGEAPPTEQERIDDVAFMSHVIATTSEFIPLSIDAVAYLEGCTLRNIQFIEEAALRKMRKVTNNRRFQVKK